MESLSWLSTTPRDSYAAASLDLNSGYYHLRLHPALQRLMVFELAGQYYTCVALPMGWNWAPAVFTRLMRVVTRTIRSPLPSGLLSSFSLSAFTDVCVSIYLDDLLLLLRAGIPAQPLINAVVEFFGALGLSIKASKSVLVPATSLEHLGLLLDFVTHSLALPERKRLKARSLALSLVERARRT